MAQANQKNPPPKAFWETLSQNQRKKLLWSIVAIFTIIIVMTWVSLFKIIIKPDIQDQKEIEQLQQLQEDLSTFINQTKETVDQVKENLNRLQNPVLPANNEIIMALKEKLLNSDLAQWQTYQNTRYGFSFKYPADWQFNTIDSNQDSQFIASVKPSEKEIENTGLWLYGSSNTTIFEKCNDHFHNQKACLKNSNDENITTDEIIVLNDDKKITIKISYQSVHQESFQEIFDKLLNTFNFSEPDKRL